jgi:hypothetical protein
MRLEGLGQLKNPMTSSEIEAATFRLAAQCLKRLRYSAPPHRKMRRKWIKVSMGERKAAHAAFTADENVGLKNKRYVYLYLTDDSDSRKNHLCLRQLRVDTGLAPWGSVFRREGGLTSDNLRVYPL